MQFVDFDPNLASTSGQPQLHVMQQAETSASVKDRAALSAVLPMLHLCTSALLNSKTTVRAWLLTATASHWPPPVSRKTVVE